jgi:hypothetical protein
MDVLLLLHGTEKICEEYIPSKMYEYLWMQRPILAVVNSNQQMAQMLAQSGHHVVMSHGETDALKIATSIETIVVELVERWRTQGLTDNGQISPFTIVASVSKLVGLAQLT